MKKLQRSYMKRMIDYKVIINSPSPPHPRIMYSEVDTVDDRTEMESSYGISYGLTLESTNQSTPATSHGCCQQVPLHPVYLLLHNSW